MAYRNRHLVIAYAALVAGTLAVDTLARLMLSAYAMSFRAWDVVRMEHHPTAPFWPMVSYEKTIHGDLSFMLKVPQLRSPRHQVFTTDQFGYRNPPLPPETRYPVVVAGDSDMAGSSLSDEQTFRARLAGLLGVRVYNYAPRTAQEFLDDERFRQRPPAVLVWEAVEHTLVSEAAKEARRNAPGALARIEFQPRRERGNPRLTQRSAAWLFNGLLWRLLGEARYLNPAIAHVDRATGMIFYQPAVVLLRDSPPERGLEDLVEEIVAVDTACRGRGIRMVYLPLPDKENIYQDRLPENLRAAVRFEFLEALADALDRRGVANVRLHRAYAPVAQDESLYLVDDTHWSPAGVALAARETAGLIQSAGWLADGEVADSEPAENPDQ